MFGQLEHLGAGERGLASPDGLLLRRIAVDLDYRAHAV